MSFNFKKLIRLRQIINFVTIGIISFFLFEAVEHLILEYYEIDFSAIKIGWLALILIYGFKYHIICCLIPFIWAAYQCTHEKCEHEHCDNQQKN